MVMSSWRRRNAENAVTFVQHANPAVRFAWQWRNQAARQYYYRANSETGVFRWSWPFALAERWLQLMLTAPEYIIPYDFISSSTAHFNRCGLVSKAFNTSETYTGTLCHPATDIHRDVVLLRFMSYESFLFSFFFLHFIVHPSRSLTCLHESRHARKRQFWPKCISINWTPDQNPKQWMKTGRNDAIYFYSVSVSFHSHFSRRVNIFVVMMMFATIAYSIGDSYKRTCMRHSAYRNEEEDTLANMHRALSLSFFYFLRYGRYVACK